MATCFVNIACTSVLCGLSRGGPRSRLSVSSACQGRLEVPPWRRRSRSTRRLWFLCRLARLRTILSPRSAAATCGSHSALSAGNRSSLGNGPISPVRLALFRTPPNPPPRPPSAGARTARPAAPSAPRPARRRAAAGRRRQHAARCRRGAAIGILRGVRCVPTPRMDRSRHGSYRMITLSGDNRCEGQPDRRRDARPVRDRGAVLSRR